MRYKFFNFWLNFFFLSSIYTRLQYEDSMIPFPSHIRSSSTSISLHFMSYTREGNLQDFIVWCQQRRRIIYNPWIWIIAYVYEQYPLKHWLIATDSSRVLTATLFFTLNTEYGLRCTALDIKVKDVALSLWSCCIFPIFIKFIYNETCVKWPLNCVVSQGRWSFKKWNINLLRKMHMVDVVLCYVVVRHQPISPISFRVTSLVLGQSHDCPSASETTLNDMGKSITSSRKGCYDYNNTKHNKTMRILFGMYHKISNIRRT